MNIPCLLLKCMYFGLQHNDLLLNSRFSSHRSSKIAFWTDCSSGMDRVAGLMPNMKVCLPLPKHFVLEFENASFTSKEEVREHLKTLTKAVLDVWNPDSFGLRSIIKVLALVYFFQVLNNRFIHGRAACADYKSMLYIHLATPSTHLPHVMFQTRTSLLLTVRMRNANIAGRPGNEARFKSHPRQPILFWKNVFVLLLHCFAFPCLLWMIKVMYKYLGHIVLGVQVCPSQ